MTQFRDEMDDHRWDGSMKILGHPRDHVRTNPSPQKPYTGFDFGTGKATHHIYRARHDWANGWWWELVSITGLGAAERPDDDLSEAKDEPSKQQPNLF